NRLENLVILLDKVMQTGANSNILNEEIILVQSKGMQHWLNLKLAQSRGISMNLAFSLPMQFFWNQIRAILGKDNVPEHSLYTREVLSWRIHSLLATEQVINHPLCKEATLYWLSNSDKQNNQRLADEDKRFQLSCQLADLFEQYLIFRPDWIQSWSGSYNKEIEQPEHWQAMIWQLLIKQQPLHPIALLNQAIKTLKQKKCALPERISLFGINTLPPLWLDFLSQLGEQTQVHFFHLNPCVEYWGDLKTDKAQAREHFYRWINKQENSELFIDEALSVNPLLSNLGSQGKDFLHLLQDRSNIEIPVFESPISEQADNNLDSATTVTLLQRIQADILNLYDARIKPEKITDNSIVFASAHSALREIQALHDWLLHQINDDKTLTPKDILVMCPNVENYAPYVEAVFAHGWNDWSEDIPPLPCSIADRTLKDSEPLVQAFIDLLELPDSRFQVSQILGYLRLPAVQDKFGFATEDLSLLERWINHASIHWGLDAAHKQQTLLGTKSDAPSSNEKFTWLQGLNRLLLGFAQGDQQNIYQNQLLLSDVEGEQALLLGRFFELLEQLQYSARELSKPRRPDQWQEFLQQIKENLFSSLTEDKNAQQIIEQAIDALGEYTSQANYQQTIPLTVIRDFLLAHFNQPEPGRQFMAGQVTFCSMLPMRSVPFRIIAVLGLNDGEFPRQRQPMGFDLMANEPPRKGDRSRRGDDRYLFLEALISCREKLYLSYQGHDIKTNNIREPSLVLKELMDYLEKAYTWKLVNIPLQAFSKDNYRQPLNSFNAQWLKLSEPGLSRDNLTSVNESLPIDSLLEQTNDNEIILTAEDLLRFFDNPCKSFSQTKLGLYFDSSNDLIIEDSEPFVTTHLDRYLVQDEIVKTALLDNASEEDINEQVLAFNLSGKYPDTPNTEEDLLLWQEQACDFSQYIKTEYLNNTGSNQLTIKNVQLTIAGVQLHAELPYLGNNLLFWRLANPKGKDDMRLWIHHLIAQVYADTKNTDSKGKQLITQGVFRGEKQEAVQLVQYTPVESPQQLLAQLIQCWKDGMQQPLLLNASLGQKHCLKIKGKAKPLDNFAFQTFWQDNFLISGLGSDPYVHWFWSGNDQQIPQWEGHWQQQIEQIYMPLYEHRQ
ncbi:MAG: exodeoxyribonuclease V subunit gamma, partial [Pseudomonadota bacterium]